MSNEIRLSDKVFWHLYIPEYERLCFSKLKDPTAILEFGVWRGASIEWLEKRFPTTKIYGADILDEDPSWPHSERIRYLKTDQNDRDLIVYALSQTAGKLDLVIDDGSHDPKHQATTLLYSSQWMKPGAYYIVEDAHTSHPSVNPNSITLVHILLAFQHLKATYQELSNDIGKQLSKNSVLNKDEISYLFTRINEIYCYKRTVLPLWCWNCSNADYNYTTLKCKCGEELYKEADSMAFIIKMV